MIKFKSKLKQHVAEDWGNLRTGMPFLPTYCFNKYDSAEHGLGLTKWPHKGIDIALRCVSHCKADGKLKNISFRRDSWLVIHEEDTMDDIRDLLDGENNTRETEDAIKIDSARLFTGEHIDQWELELLGMPQRGSAKLYRFTDGQISQFLDASPLTRPKERKVFMEAHVVPNSP
ncbi:hypothetical protein M409DRAFT_21563 [Zasmidium cellare ATCC 36951]|uniref:Uncharacterized protein n=1 Tax=Zasmidium cellare ATCC 36951 TaxID=1080233 RepID=A0A6A6CRK2_ZASCE|nr:uncharacterized protein M409DRAFT_21563 [Zasmidium cellare ATCC 36951]KAF2168116.1 hypothetical protein M409DRAFT_21563 [Zasmidium cellare ATCC 36951]